MTAPLQNQNATVSDRPWAGPAATSATPDDASVAASVAPDDPRVLAALHEYQAALEAGAQPDRADYLRRHADIASALAVCLEGLELVQAGVPLLQQTASDAVAAIDTIRPEGPLGDYRIVREIGRGGMGVVYEAVQISLGRRVALKVLPFASTFDAKQLQRFQNEAQAAAQLHHTNIVPVFGTGQDRGVHYYAMQFIDGQTLAALIQERRGSSPPARRDQLDQPVGSADQPTPPLAALSTERSACDPAFFRTVAQLGIQAAEALEHAHQVGIIHRDVKPSNLLIDARGNLWVTDFGLAHCQSQAGLTMTGDLVGTLRYMSPERVLAKRVTVDHRADVYSLGATLYELLTLEPAFRGSDRQELLRQIAFEEPRAPRQINKTIPADLETIVLKAVEKNPTERYATAQELADDLKRFLNDEPIRAKRPTTVQRARKWARRHQPFVWTATVSLGVLLVMAVVGLSVSNAQIKAEQKQTKEALNRETEAKVKLAQALASEKLTQYFQRVSLARRDLTINNIGRAEELLHECEPELRGWEWHLLKRLTREPERVVPIGKVGIVEMAGSADGRYVATVGFTPLKLGEVKLRDAATGKEIHSLDGHLGPVIGVAFHPDSDQLATAGADATIRLWDVATGKELGKLEGHKGPVAAVSYSPDGKRLASASFDGTARVLDVARRAEVLSFPDHREPVTCIAFSPDGRRVVSRGMDFNVRVWDAVTGVEERRWSGHHGVLASVLFHKDGRHVVSAGADGVRVLDRETGQEKHFFKGINSPSQVLTSVRTGSSSFKVALSPDGKRLASAAWDKTVQLWDWDTGQEVLALRGHTDPVMAVAFSGDGRRLFSASIDNTLRIWDATPLAEDAPAQERRLQGHEAHILRVAFSPDQRTLATAGMDGTAKLWDVRSRKLVRTLPGHDKMVASVAFHAGGKLLTTATVDGTVVQWDSATGERRRTLPGHLGPVLNTGFNASFSADGERLASVGMNGGARVWETESVQEISATKPAMPPNLCAFLSPDGEQLAIATMGPIEIVEVKSQKRVAYLWLGFHVPHHLAFSPDGQRLAAAVWDGTVRVWDIKSGKLLHTFRHDDRATCVAFHPDGRQLASGSCDNTAKIWDLETGTEVETLRGHIGYVMTLAYSPDGTLLATSSGHRYQGEVQLWETATFGKKAP